MSTYLDGTWTTAQQTGADVYSVDNETRSSIVTRRMQIAAASWTALARGTAGPGSTKLLNETQPSSVGNGIVEWERTYGALPSARSEYESYVFGYQNIYVQYTGPSPPYVILDGTELVTVPVPTQSRLHYEYFDGDVTAPSAIPILNAFLVGEAGGTLYLFGTIPTAGQTEIVAESSSISRWRDSNFYERITRYVPRNGLTDALTP